MIKKLWEELLTKVVDCVDGLVGELILEELLERYYGVIISTDISVFNILDEFRKFHHLTIDDLEKLFKELGFQTPLEASLEKVNCIKVGEYLVYFVDNDDDKEIWVDYYGKVTKYRLNLKNHPMLYERVYLPLEGVELKLKTKMGICSLEVGKHSHIIVNVGVSEEKFWQLSNKLEEVFLEHYEDVPLKLFMAIRYNFPNNDFLSVRYEVNRGNKTIILGEIYWAEGSFEEFCTLYRGGYLHVYGKDYWNYSTKDGKMILKKTYSNLAPSFKGYGSQQMVAEFLGCIDDVQKEATRLADMYDL